MKIIVNQPHRLNAEKLGFESCSIHDDFETAGGGINWRMLNRNLDAVPQDGNFLFDREGVAGHELNSIDGVKRRAINYRNAVERITRYRRDITVIHYEPAWHQGISPKDDHLAGMQWPASENSHALAAAIFGFSVSTTEGKLACVLDVADGRPVYAAVEVARNYSDTAYLEGLACAMKCRGRWRPEAKIDGFFLFQGSDSGLSELPEYHNGDGSVDIPRVHAAADLEITRTVRLIQMAISPGPGRRA